MAGLNFPAVVRTTTAAPYVATGANVSGMCGGLAANKLASLYARRGRRGNIIGLCKLSRTRFWETSGSTNHHVSARLMSRSGSVARFGFRLLPHGPVRRRKFRTEVQVVPCSGPLKQHHRCRDPGALVFSLLLHFFCSSSVTGGNYQ